MPVDVVVLVDRTGAAQLNSHAFSTTFRGCSRALMQTVPTAELNLALVEIRGGALHPLHPPLVRMTTGADSIAVLAADLPRCEGNARLQPFAAVFQGLRRAEEALRAVRVAGGGDGGGAREQHVVLLTASVPEPRWFRADVGDDGRVGGRVSGGSEPGPGATSRANSGVNATAESPWARLCRRLQEGNVLVSAWAPVPLGAVKDLVYRTARSDDVDDTTIVEAQDGVCFFRGRMREVRLHVDAAESRKRGFGASAGGQRSRLASALELSSKVRAVDPSGGELGSVGEQGDEQGEDEVRKQVRVALPMCLVEAPINYYAEHRFTETWRGVVTARKENVDGERTSSCAVRAIEQHNGEGKFMLSLGARDEVTVGPRILSATVGERIKTELRHGSVMILPASEQGRAEFARLLLMMLCGSDSLHGPHFVGSVGSSVVTLQSVRQQLHYYIMLRTFEDTGSFWRLANELSEQF